MRERDASFAEFATAAAPALFRSAWLLTGDWHLAEDLVQDALARMYRMWGGIGRIDNPAAYAQTVLARQFLSFRRRRSNAERPSGDLPDTASRGVDTDLHLALVAALAELPKRDRLRSPTMDEDERFSAVLHRAVSTLEPPTERLVSGAIARGRRRRRWIRGAEVGTTAIVLAGVAGLVVALIPGGSSAPASAPPAGPVHRTTTAAKPARPKPTTVAMTPQALLQTALDTLPRPGKTSHYAGNFGTGFASAWFVYNDGHGTAAVTVAIQAPTSAPHAAVITPCTPRTAGCRPLADGSHVQVRQGTQYQDGRTPNATEWDLDLVRRDGVEVSFIEWNAPAPKGAAPTRALPPFTIAELTHWADSPRFTTTISAGYANQTAHLFKPAKPRRPADRFGYVGAPATNELPGRQADPQDAAGVLRQAALTHLPVRSGWIRVADSNHIWREGDA